ncbi:DUF4127 family protein [Meiothermus cerbereus]|uniref:DUF4127 family protein n=1 Tax=Meiothermus cerbereus TaxID=65552 RepID=UPI00048744C6|nr:DUF4127 family protein [Meiothermus cerbereus]
MKRVLLIPADTRPVTLELPHQMAQLAGLEVRSLPLEILNQMNQPGNTAAIAEWLWREAPAAGVCALGGGPVALAEASFACLVDDWLYQSRVRGEVQQALTEDPSPYDLGELQWGAELAIEQRLSPLAHSLWQQYFAPSLPGVMGWPRLSNGVFPLRLVQEEG